VDTVAVVWSRRALRDRDRIFSYVAAQSTPARAYAVIRAIAESAAWLGETPDGGVEIGSQRRELVVPHLPCVLEYERRTDRVHGCTPRPDDGDVSQP
jgi:plasmid stabilization system protein ParE